MATCNRPFDSAIRTIARMLGVANDLADRLLFPNAQLVDRSDRVPTAHLAALADAGLFDLEGTDRVEIRRILAAIAGGCGATFFVWAQHHGVVRTLRSSPNTSLVDRWLRSLCAGSSIAGVAFAHLRRAGRPAVRAVRASAGWSFSGVAPWATSWGIADRFAVAAVDDDGRVVWALLPGANSDDGRFVAKPLALPVLGATGTVVLHFDDHRVDDADIMAFDDLDRWRTADRTNAAQGAAGVLGVADRAVRELAAGGAHDDVAIAAARRLRSTLDDLWRLDDEFTATPPTTEADIEAASDHRARCLRLGRSATTALLAASGGRGMDLSHPAQRLAREADFYVIQAQTGDGRSAVLRGVN